jgi:hypothetical protein
MHNFNATWISLVNAPIYNTRYEVWTDSFQFRYFLRRCSIYYYSLLLYEILQFNFKFYTSYPESLPSFLPYLLTYSLTPHSTVLEKLTGLQLVKKLPTFYGTRRFINTFTSAHHLSLYWASWIQSILPHSTSWRSTLIACIYIYIYIYIHTHTQ